MLPGITERQAGYARDVGAALGDVADVRGRASPRATARTSSASCASSRPRGSTACSWSCSPTGPACASRGRCRRRGCRSAWPTSSPCPRSRPRGTWPTSPTTRASTARRTPRTRWCAPASAFHVITDDWQRRLLPRRRRALGARGARDHRLAVAAGGDLRLPDDGDGRHPRGRGRAAARARPAGRLRRPRRPVARTCRRWSARRSRRRSPRRTSASRSTPRSAARSARTTSGCRSRSSASCASAAAGAYSTHFDAIAEDGRFARLPMAAASTLMARGFGFAGEGDALTAALVAAGHELLGDAHFTEMYAMDFPSDSILMSHMGEGNWRVARTDRKPRLIKRPLGIGGLADPPTILFQYQPGPATLATLLSIGGDRFRLIVGRGRGARHGGAAEPGDALRALPAGLRRARVPRRLAAPRRAAPPGHAPRAASSRRGGSSAR